MLNKWNKVSECLPPDIGDRQYLVADEDGECQTMAILRIITGEGGMPTLEWKCGNNLLSDKVGYWKRVDSSNDIIDDKKSICWCNLRKSECPKEAFRIGEFDCHIKNLSSLLSKLSEKEFSNNKTSFCDNDDICNIPHLISFLIRLQREQKALTTKP